VGRAAHLRLCAVSHVSRHHRAHARSGRSGPLRAVGGNPDAGGLRQHPDHQILGRLVEHAASTGLRLPAGRANDPSEPALAASCLRAGLHAAVPFAAYHGYAGGNLAPARCRHATHVGARRRSAASHGPRLVTHTAYVIAAYLVAALGIAGLAAWILLDQRTQKRALEELEARGIRRRSESRRAGESPR